MLEGLDGDVVGSFNDNTVSFIQDVPVDLTGFQPGDVLMFVSGALVPGSPFGSVTGSIRYWADLAAAQATPTGSLDAGDLAVLRTVQGTWQWLPNADLADDAGGAVIAPNEATSSTGRFVRLSDSQHAFTLHGEFGQEPVSGTFGPPLVLDRPRVLSSVTIARRKAGGGGVTRVDVTVGGQSVFATAADKPTAAATDGDNWADKVTPTISGSGLCIVPATTFVDCVLEWSETPRIGGAGPEGLSVVLGFI